MDRSLCWLARPPVAAELPGDAKKLAGDEVMALYHGRSADFEEFTQKVPYAGTAFFDLKKKRMWGFYLWDGRERGLYKGTASVMDDQLCSTTEDDDEICAFVHVAGDKAYEVDEAGKVVSVLTFLPLGKPALPASAVKATPESFTQLTDQKSTNIVVHDYETPFIGRLYWDWSNKKMVGELIVDEKKSLLLRILLKIDPSLAQTWYSTVGGTRASHLWCQCQLQAFQEMDEPCIVSGDEERLKPSGPYRPLEAWAKWCRRFEIDQQYSQ